MAVRRIAFDLSSEADFGVLAAALQANDPGRAGIELALHLIGIAHWCAVDLIDDVARAETSARCEPLSGFWPVTVTGAGEPPGGASALAASVRR